MQIINSTDMYTDYQS